MTSEPRYNLWYKNELLIECKTWAEIEDEMGYRCLHKHDVDIEIIDNN